ncbi:MAG: hypothetical protein D6814_09845, partial [Calditrichaeota bacterium]
MILRNVFLFLIIFCIFPYQMLAALLPGYPVWIIIITVIGLLLAALVVASKYSTLFVFLEKSAMAKSAFRGKSQSSFYQAI